MCVTRACSPACVRVLCVCVHACACMNGHFPTNLQQEQHGQSNFLSNVPCAGASSLLSDLEREQTRSLCVVTIFSESRCYETNSATGTRTRVARVRAEYPNQLDYSGCWIHFNMDKDLSLHPQHARQLVTSLLPLAGGNNQPSHTRNAPWLLRAPGRFLLACDPGESHAKSEP